MLPGRAEAHHRLGRHAEALSEAHRSLGLALDPSAALCEGRRRSGI
ncbi:hypothetical protein HD597_004058 [Nonomuraea thailandensis]|uniref:Tetratricopeptide repeat protein n=1 Tax=Nonomuraea thailandensis TaxID=1188745 RepID=A0A9X2K1I8_9ACTN|nr:hypothetical protein [Nonomuraea thailandensis]MCP2357038.1 hypothetical protein [Nonomuraea thailandensis]